MRAEIIDSIEDNFYKPVDEKKLDDASLKGIVESLDDPYSHYLTPKEAKQLNESVSGHFEGVGMNVEQNKRGLKVLRVFDGAPAERAGIRRGDFILGVNGRSIAGVNSRGGHQPHQGGGGDVGDAACAHPRPGTRPHREGEARAHRDSRRARAHGRARAATRSASWSCSASAPAPTVWFASEVDKLLDQGAEAIVFDLRGNGGGLLSEAVLVSSIFIEDGEIVSVRGRHRPERTQDAEGDAIDEKIPVVTLVDGGSASASEIVTGALRDRKRAKVVGTRTFGKGLVQEIQQLSNGGVLDITVANYYLPGGETISTKGIKPEIRAVDDPDTDRDEALPVAVDELLRELR